MARVPGPVPTGRTVLAVLAGWVMPGLGHVLLGRIRRGILFGVIVLGSFALGLAHDGRLALHDARQPFLTGLQVVANAGVGPADALARVAVYGRPTYALPRDVADPRYDERMQTLRRRASSGLSAYGTAYLWSAGLMNLLLLFDIWDIGRGRKA